MTAKQGHRYTHNGRACIALSSGDRPRVAFISSLGWFSKEVEVNASELVEQPMRYFSNQFPSGGCKAGK